MSDNLRKGAGWALIVLCIGLFIAVMVWFFNVPERESVVQEPTPTPCVCPKPEVPEMLPETGVRG